MPIPASRRHDGGGAPHEVGREHECPSPHFSESFLLYAICDGTAVKFGVARGPVARMGNLQVGNPRGLSLVAVVDDIGYGAERAVHEFLAADCVRGEWFGGERVAAVVAAMKAGVEELKSALGGIWYQDIDAASWDEGRVVVQLKDRTYLRDRGRYNAYQREYMRKRRAGLR